MFITDHVPYCCVHVIMHVYAKDMRSLWVVITPSNQSGFGSRASKLSNVSCFLYFARAVDPACRRGPRVLESQHVI